MSSSKNLQIPLQEIVSATNEFSEANVIGKGAFGKVYRCQLREHGLLAIKRLNPVLGQGVHEYGMEVALLSKYKHENVVSLIGFCGEAGEKILVYKYEANQSLDKYLGRKELSWMRRLQICIGAARGLRYLHSGTGSGHGVIHRDIKSSNILLDENWKAKISDFGLSKIALVNSADSVMFTGPCGTMGYVDPQILFGSGVTQKSDVYSFGVVLYEVLFGKLVCIPDRLRDGRNFTVQIAQKHYKEKTLHIMIDPDLRNEMNSDSLNTFSSIAYRCLKHETQDRPTMSTVVEALEKALGYQQATPRESVSHRIAAGVKWGATFSVNMIKGKKNDSVMAIFSQQIKAEELSFLNNDNGLASFQIISKGGYGEVYKLDLALSQVKTIVIEKITQSPKDAAELTKEDTMLLNKKMRRIKSEIQTVGQFRHRNLAPLLAHVSRPNCDYLVYKFMKNGSLLDILQQVKDGSRELDWQARRRIALGVAAGLEYLHSSNTLHRDLNPTNVLLDDDMEACITNFGLAESIADAYTCTLMKSSNVTVTWGYIAPEYHQTMKFTDKCDIYSFGVVLAVLGMGKLPSDEFFQRTSEISIVKCLRYMMTSDDPNIAIDPDLMGNGSEEQILLFLKIACFCTLDNPMERPNSKDVRVMLAHVN